MLPVSLALALALAFKSEFPATPLFDPVILWTLAFGTSSTLLLSEDFLDEVTPRYSGGGYGGGRAPTTLEVAFCDVDEFEVLPVAIDRSDWDPALDEVGVEEGTDLEGGAVLAAALACTTARTACEDALLAGNLAAMAVFFEVSFARPVAFGEAIFSGACTLEDADLA